MQNFITISWAIFCIFWLVNAKSVKPTQEKAGGICGKLHFLPIAIGVVFLENFFIKSSLFYPLSSMVIPSSTIVNLLCILVTTLGLIIAISARMTLGSNWSGVVTFKKNHELIKTGVYKYMRHPIYTGVLLMFLGTMLLFGTLSSIIGFLILVLSFWLKLKKEEEVMIKHFTKEYIEYKKQVKAIIPYIF